MKPRYTHPEQALCKGLTRSDYDSLSKRDKPHFQCCQKCGWYFDARRFDQVIAHSFLDHDACTPAAQEFKGIRGKPVTIRQFKVQLLDGRIIDGAEFDRRRVSARRRKRRT